MNRAFHDSLVISGVACLLPGCNSLEDHRTRFQAGLTGIGPYRDEHIQTQRVSWFGHIDEAQRAKAADAVPFKLRRFSTPSSQWAVWAAREALREARLELSQVPEDRRGLFTAQGDYMYPSLPAFSNGLATAIQQSGLDLRRLTQELLGPRGIDPFVSIKGLANNLLAIASLTFQTRGDCGAFVQDESAFLGALRQALFSLRHGYCDVALLICAGSYNECFTLTELIQMGRLSAYPNGAASMRPFDIQRDGSILAEGAVAFVLERGADAHGRGVRPLAILGGIGCHLADPDSTPLAYLHCAEQAFGGEGGAPRVDAIIAQGLSGADEDAREANLLRHLQATGTPITCASPITGLAPACPLEVLTAIGLLGQTRIPPIPHLESPICDDLPLVAREPRDTSPIHHVLALSAHPTGWHTGVYLVNPEVLTA